MQNNNRNSPEAVNQKLASLDPVVEKDIIIKNYKPIDTVTIRSSLLEDIKMSSNSVNISNIIESLLCCK